MVNSSKIEKAIESLRIAEKIAKDFLKAENKICSEFKGIDVGYDGTVGGAIDG